MWVLRKQRDPRTNGGGSVYYAGPSIGECNWTTERLFAAKFDSFEDAAQAQCENDALTDFVPVSIWG